METKIIFLDIDGVIATNDQFFTDTKKFREDNPWAKELRVCYLFDNGCVNILNEILELTGAEIVLSSTWKMGRTIEDLDFIFKKNGVIKSPIAFTPNEWVSFSNTTKNRAYQIGCYIQENNVKNYVVIDDLPVGEYMKITNDDDKFVLTNDMEGLKQEGIKDKILNILKTNFSN